MLLTADITRARRVLCMLSVLAVSLAITSAVTTIRNSTTKLEAVWTEVAPASVGAPHLMILIETKIRPSLVMDLLFRVNGLPCPVGENKIVDIRNHVFVPKWCMLFCLDYCSERVRIQCLATYNSDECEAAGCCWERSRQPECFHSTGESHMT